MEVVQDVHDDAADFEGLGLRDARQDRGCVAIPQHGGDWCNLPERFENRRVPHVARVNDPGAATERRDRFRPQQTMRIGNEAHSSHRINMNQQNGMVTNCCRNFSSELSLRTRRILADGPDIVLACPLPRARNGNHTADWATML